MTIEYQSDLAGIDADDLTGGFFAGWTEPLDPAGHLDVLTNSDLIEVAVDRSDGQVVGFVTALTDGRQAAFIPLLEVLADHQGAGIGTTLMRRILARLGDLNGGRGINVDLSCDDDLVGFYQRLGMQPGRAMFLRPALDRR